MKKILYISILITVFILPHSVVYAQKGSGGTGNGQENGDQMRVQDPATHEEGTPVGSQGNQVQNQNQVNTQNQGEDTQLKVNTQNNEASQFGSEDVEKQKGSTNKSGNARQHMSSVSLSVEKFLSTGNKIDGIGKQVSDLAKQQQGAQNQIGKALDEIEGKKGLVKKLFGPDYGALKDMKQLMQQNQVRIQQLQQLQNQTQNQGEDTQLQEFIQAMVNQNTALQSQVQAEENVKSAFGWLIKFFN
ncbi:hypothetical protein ACFL0C_00435 [Patescibacteria group bacterium]